MENDTSENGSLSEQYPKGKVVAFVCGTKEDRALQEEKIEEYCRENELNFVGLFSYEVVPSIEELWFNLKAYVSIDGLVVTHIDRISRSRNDFIEILERALENKLKLYIIEQPYFSDTQALKAILPVMDSLKQYDEEEEEKQVDNFHFQYEFGDIVALPPDTKRWRVTSISSDALHLEDANGVMKIVYCPTDIVKLGGMEGTLISSRPKIKVGDTVPIKEEHKRLVKRFSDSVDAAFSGLKALSEQLRFAQRNLWGLLDELYPETKEFVGVLDSEKMVIRLGVEKSQLKKVPEEYRDAIIEAFSEE